MKRPGHSLIEMQLAGTIALVLMGGAASIYAMVTRASSDDPARFTWNTLADQLRSDLHAGNRVERDAVARSFTIYLPEGETIEYREAGARWNRVSRGEQDDAASPQTWPLPEGMTLRWTTLRAQPGEIATLFIEPAGDDRSTDRLASKRPLPIVVSAMLGRDLRWRK